LLEKEFLMGYKNEYGVYPDTLFINKPRGDIHLLPLDPAASGKRNLGHNTGSIGRSDIIGACPE
jgi:hypothetical protein